MAVDVRAACVASRAAARRTSWIAIALAACGARSTAATDLPSLEPNGSGSATPVVRSSTTLPDAVVSAASGQALIVDDFTSLALFGDERLAAQQIIADWATANGLTIIAPKKVEDLIAKAARGIDPTTGAACGPGLDRELALERWVDANGHVKAMVRCKDECRLQVEINLRSRGTEFFAAPFDTSKPWRDELKLRLANVVDNGGHNQHGHGNNPVDVAGVKRGADDLLEPTELDVGANKTAIAHQCGLRGMGVAVVLDGTRCERYADPALITETDPAIVACACGKIATAVTPGKRSIARLLAPNVAPDRVQTTAGNYAYAEIIGGNEYRTFGVAWFMPGQSYAHVSQCFASHATLEERKEVDATIEFDREGRATKATIGDPNGLLQPAEIACLQTALRTLRTPCPTESAPVGTARISWRVAAS